MTTIYTLYGEYDEHGQVRQISVLPPEHTSLETIGELVRMLFRAGHGAVLPSLAETRVLHPNVGDPAVPEFWNASSYR